MWRSCPTDGDRRRDLTPTASPPQWAPSDAWVGQIAWFCARGCGEGPRTSPAPTRSIRRRGQPSAAGGQAPPLPIVLHDGERVGVRGRCEHRRCGRSLCSGGPPQRPHAPRPLTLTLSPRREERRGERGTRASPAPSRSIRRRGATLRRRRAGAPSPHRPSRWGEGRGEGQMRAPAVRPVAPAVVGRPDALTRPGPSP